MSYKVLKEENIVEIYDPAENKLIFRGGKKEVAKSKRILHNLTSLRKTGELPFVPTFWTKVS